MEIDDDGEAKKMRTMCLNLAGNNYAELSKECMIKAYEESAPAFVVMSDTTKESTGTGFGVAEGPTRRRSSCG